MQQIRSLDGFRGLAALMVMWFHYFEFSHHSGNSTLAHWFQRFMNVGQGGVELFFVLSGFLITRILLSTRSDSRYLPRFYARRSLRIFPLYFGFLIIFAVNSLIVDGQLPVWGEHWYFWAFIQNLPYAFGWATDGPIHYWSLAVEEQFYFVWPFLVLLLSRKWLVRVGVVLLVMPIILRVILIPMGVDVYFLTLTRMDGLALGALLAIFEPQIVANRSALFGRFRLVLFVTVPLVIVGFALFGGQLNYWFRTVKFLAIAICGAMTLGMLLTCDDRHPLRRFFASRFMVFTGRLSFGLYVFQSLCFNIFENFVPGFNSLLRLPIAFAMLYGIAWLSFRYFESPILKYKCYFAYDREPKPEQSNEVESMVELSVGGELAKQRSATP
jgi:peptidoglycan/LPS O-acetylase OafA/YrhL